MLAEPLPNVQFHEVGPPAEVSMNRTTSGAGPELGSARKSAINSGATRMVKLVLLDWCARLETVNLTGKLPALV